MMNACSHFGLTFSGLQGTAGVLANSRHSHAGYYISRDLLARLFFLMRKMRFLY